MPGDSAAACHASYRRLNPAPAVWSFASLPSVMRIYLVVLVTLSGAILAHGLTHVPLDRLPLFLTLRVSDVLALISTRLPGMLPFTASALFLFDDASQFYLCRHATGAHHESTRAVTSATIDGIAGALPGPRRAANPAARFESVLLAPLQLDGRTVGALAFYHTARGAFGADRQMSRDKSARAAGNHGTGNPRRSQVNQSVRRTRSSSLRHPAPGTRAPRAVRAVR